jgi:type III secretion protein X
MADIRINTGLSFERGIDRIVHEQGSALDGLPDKVNLPPSELAQAMQLEQLLSLPNLGDFLERALQPDLENKELLQPGHFRDVLNGVQQMLRDAAAANPDDARTLNRAARLLAEEADLRDLLQAYRSMLLQG